MLPVPIAPPYQLIETRHGLMLVNPNDLYMGQSFLRYGECCEREIQVLLQLLSHPQTLPGTVIEVGSNMGVHTVPLARELARQNRQMLALEPQPVIFRQLCSNLAINGLMNVTALPCACGAESGQLAFVTPNYLAPGNFGGIAMSSSPRRPLAQPVPCRTLDSLAPGEPVALIKADVEGHELRVLKGAQQILSSFHPILYVENDRIENSAPLIDFLLANGYRLWWHTTQAFNPQNFLHADHNIYGDVCLINMLGLHPAHKMTIDGLPEITDPSQHPLKDLTPARQDVQQTQEPAHTPCATPR